MYIHEAVKIASDFGAYITRRKFGDRVHIIPTDAQEGCLLQIKGKDPCPRWQPKAEDLLADDWTVTREEVT